MGLAGVQEEGEEFEFEVALPEDAALKRHEPKSRFSTLACATINVVIQPRPSLPPAMPTVPRHSSSTAPASQSNNRYGSG